MHCKGEEGRVEKDVVLTNAVLVVEGVDVLAVR